MAATKKTPPGIKKPSPRSSKVVPITPRELRSFDVRLTSKDVKPPNGLRQKFSNLLESFALTISRFARWVRA